MEQEKYDMIEEMLNNLEEKMDAWPEKIEEEGSIDHSDIIETFRNLINIQQSLLKEF